VARLPDLAALARTGDEINRRQTFAAHLHGPLLNALTDGIAGATALVAQALDCHLEHHTTSAEAHPADDVDDYATLLVKAHRSASRRAEFLISGYASFLGGAIEAAGALAEAELAATRNRRWDRSDPEQRVGQHAGQVYSALVNALGGLLAYARLIAEDAAREH
jgi:hypothetical protein